MPKTKPKKPVGSSVRSFAVLFIIVLILSVFYLANYDKIQNQVKPIVTIPLSQAIEDFNQDKVQKLEIRDQKLTLIYKDGGKAESRKEASANIKDLGLDLTKAEVEVINTEGSKFWWGLLSSLLPFLIIIIFFVLIFRSMRGSANPFTAVQGQKENKGSTSTVKFTDVAGVDEAKEDLVEIVDFLKQPKKYTSMGARIPRGVLLFGPPGTGKTLLAKAIAGEAHVPFFNMSGSEFEEMFVGVGASRARGLFEKAKKAAPAIIFIDELDAIGRNRGAKNVMNHNEQTLNQILVEMDGFDTKTNVIVIAATNRPDVLDPALLRPGRFDRRILISLPNISEREAILKVHARGKDFDKNVDFFTIAKQTPGFSGADLANILNESAIFAAKRQHGQIPNQDIEDAIEKVMMGATKKSRMLSEKEKEITAYHEAGHAITAYMLPNCDPVHKVSIISRGMALGVTWFLPERDEYLRSYSKFIDEIISLLGGFIAEKIVYGEVTTGASNDLQRATEIARRMVAEYGMSEKLGPVIYEDDRPNPFFVPMNDKNYSEETAKKIDHEIKSIIDAAAKKAEQLIKKNKVKLNKVVKKLMEKEMLDRDEFERLMK